jgi:hypothetical protein
MDSPFQASRPIGESVSANPIVCGLWLLASGFWPLASGPGRGVFGDSTALKFRASGGSTFVLDEIFEAGAILVGRRMFDLASAWGSRSPIRDAPVFVVTHKPPTKHAFDGSPFTFVTDGIESEIQIHLDSPTRGGRPPIRRRPTQRHRTAGTDAPD